MLAGRHRDTEASRVDLEFQEVLKQIDEDLRPYRLTNITLEMVESSYCSCTHSSWRLQVVNGSMYVAGEIKPYQTRNESVKRQLLELVRLEGPLPDLDIYFDSQDHAEYCPLGESEACKVRGPHLQQAKKPENDHLILIPGPTFGGWPEVKFSKWVEMQQTMGLAAQQNPWEERDPALFFIGCNLGPQRNVLFDNQEAIRRDHPEVSINWICWDDPALVPPVFDFCKHKHLLNVMGSSWSSRAKYLFLCGSTVVFPDSPFFEFWYRILVNGHNVVRTPAITRENRGEPMLEAARALLANETDAKRMADNAWFTGMTTLSPENLRRYWRRLLTEYAALQTFKPTVHPDAIPLHLSLSHPKFFLPHERSCDQSVCPRKAH
ncbi:hypothetical protein WJX73_004751 [Symbiochloris irregularis]|uniref:Glycosyl transferase CAP10 domain-containing protein n=1 Tax=Symbiochloris irregularis TaxID=706552 RepID=A0AAW1PAU9_9CHLO